MQQHHTTLTAKAIQLFAFVYSFKKQMRKSMNPKVNIKQQSDTYLAAS